MFCSFKTIIWGVGSGIRHWYLFKSSFWDFSKVTAIVTAEMLFFTWNINMILPMLEKTVKSYALILSFRFHIYIYDMYVYIFLCIFLIWYCSFLSYQNTVLIQSYQTHVKISFFVFLKVDCIARIATCVLYSFNYLIPNSNSGASSFEE